MDKPAASLAIAVGVLLVLIWNQFQQVAPMAIGADVNSIVVVATVVVGLTVYIQSHSAR